MSSEGTSPPASKHISSPQAPLLHISVADEICLMLPTYQRLKIAFRIWAQRCHAGVAHGLPNVAVSGSRQ
jgi:hypothetical protein